MDDEMKRVIGIIDDIEMEDWRLSVTDYEMSLAAPEDVATLQEQFKRVQRNRNNIVNGLKAEGYELEWDSDLIFVKKNGNPYLKRTGKWETWTYQLPLIG